MSIKLNSKILKLQYVEFEVCVKAHVNDVVFKSTYTEVLPKSQAQMKYVNHRV